MKRSPPHRRAGHHRIGGFPVLVQSDVTGGYWVSCPFFEGCYSQGNTIDEALKNIRESIELCLEERQKAANRATDPDISIHFVHV